MMDPKGGSGGQSPRRPAISDVRSQRFVELAARFCPVTAPETIWCASRQEKPLPGQGFKLHLSADLRHAIPLIERVGPFLMGNGVHFKMIRSLEHLSRLNAGHYGVSQIGKVITVYPGSIEEARLLAERLADLTGGLRGPRVPSDRRYRPDTPVYYRFGCFSGPGHDAPEDDALLEDVSIGEPGARRAPADERRSGNAVPPWVADPLATPESQALEVSSRRESFLRHQLLIFQAMSQRGKGGVYAALDLTARPPRVVVLKEGRRDGETNWAGQDGYLRLRYECEVLKFLGSAGLRVPRLHRTFELDQNLYAVMSFVRGASLERLTTRRSGRLEIPMALRIGAQVAELLAHMHEVGWVWRDCKPLNLILELEGTICPIDFEGACPIGAPPTDSWVTPAYAPPELRRGARVQDFTQLDRYALGVCLYQFLSGRHPEPDGALPPIGRSRRGIPPAARELILQLTSADPAVRPTARAAALLLRQMLGEAEGPSPTDSGASDQPSRGQKRG